MGKLQGRFSVRRASDKGWQELRSVFERALAAYFPARDNSRLGRAMRYALFPGGKRLRPLLCLITFRACGGRGLRPVLPFACGIELIHTFSLIQDDLPCMDNDELRRGKPTLHREFDEATALLAADALFAKAFELFAVARAAPDRALAAIREMARVSGAEGIVGGQMRDLGLGARSPVGKGGKPNHQPTRPNPQSLLKTHQQKTAALFSASFKVGALIARAPAAVVQGMARVGTDLGMLFQICDDLLDERQDRVDRQAEPEAMNYLSLYSRTGTILRARQYLRKYQTGLSQMRSDLHPEHLDLLTQAGDRVLRPVRA